MSINVKQFVCIYESITKIYLIKGLVDLLLISILLVVLFLINVIKSVVILSNSVGVTNLNWVPSSCVINILNISPINFLSAGINGVFTYESPSSWLSLIVSLVIIVFKKFIYILLYCLFVKK